METNIPANTKYKVLAHSLWVRKANYSHFLILRLLVHMFAECQCNDFELFGDWFKTKYTLWILCGDQRSKVKHMEHDSPWDYFWIRYVLSELCHMAFLLFARMWKPGKVPANVPHPESWGAYHLATTQGKNQVCELTYLRNTVSNYSWSSVFLS